ncbi:MAG: hypothetical protein MZV64_06630 [Ignavibacteriales bacterium]|nr:hypothetical protein [Ignavibacteriales bacterium]
MWITVYVMHWIALWNMAVLPINILWLAVPLTFINVLVGALISKYFQSKEKYKSKIELDKVKREKKNKNDIVYRP